jgi:hypothetical protein
VDEWVIDQIQKWDKARELMAKQREAKLRRANKGRSQTQIADGDLVLIARKRFPQWSTPKLGSQWFGPFKVSKAMTNSVQVQASPKLGGPIVVAYDQLKKFPIEIYEDDPWDDVVDDVAVSAEDSRNMENLASQVEDRPVLDGNLEEEIDGKNLFEVESIQAHRYKRGWQFLVFWKGYPASEATWEPWSNFIDSKGEVTAIFLQYLRANKLDALMRHVDALSARRQI